jgi:hypothetical protein
VQGTFTAAGGEDHLTLGNFLTDGATTAVAAAGTNLAFYYYDDVSVVALCSPSVTNKTVLCGTAWTFDPPTGFDNCSGTNVTVTVAGTVTNGSCPLLITRTWTLTDLCGNTNTWSQSVTVVDNTPPTVNCPCFQNAASALLTTNACFAAVPDLSSLSNSDCFSSACGSVQLSQSPAAGTVVGVGVHPLTLSVIGCSGNSNGCVLTFQVNQPPSNLSLICASNKTVECGSLWIFEPPTPVTTCCNPASTLLVLSTTASGTCPQVRTRVWQLTDACNNSLNCTQVVTIVDTTPPVTQCSGVNLVPNGQFEFFTNCPFADSQFDFASPWFTPTSASSDYFNSCGGPYSPVSTPTNVVGVQVPLSGQGYAGAFVYGTNAGISYREYLEVPLLAPLVAGRTYLVSFNVSRSPFYGYAAAEIGARLSTGPIISNSYNGVLNFVPQIVNPSANVITSTTNWTLIQGSFTALGGESHLTLGNFRPDPLTTTVLIGGYDNTASYYYFDDVSVVAICNPSVTNKTVACGSPIVFDPPVGSDACSGTNVTVTVASTITSGTCPKVVTRTWRLTDQCGNSNTWSQVVTIVDTNPPVVLCSGANLVPNSQFESYTNCPNYAAEFGFAAPWFAPTLASPDYFNACAPGGSIVSVPTNFAGVQAALSGQGYGGAVLDTTDGNDLANSYREYIEVPLIAPLVAGQSYLVSFHVSLADFSALAMAEIGARLSVGPLVDYASQVGLPVIPQVVNPPYNLLTSTNNWMLVQGIFTAAGGENHLTLGNFLSDADTTAVPAGGDQPFAYYYFDDVSVAPVCQPPTSKTVPCGTPWTFDPPAGFDACSGTNVTVTVAGTTTNACGNAFTRTWTLTDLCGNATNWSQTVSIAGSAPPTINCGCLQDSDVYALYTNSCAGIVPNLLQFTNCFSTSCRPVLRTQSPPAGTVLGAGVHPITVSVLDCSGGSNGCVLPFWVDPSPPIVICPRNLYLLTCDTAATAFFAVQVSGNTGAIVCSPPSGSAFPLGTTLVTCTVTNGCGGTATCTFTVNVRQVSFRFGCRKFAIAIPFTPIGSADMVFLPDFPGGGAGVDFANLGASGQDGVQLDFGPAQKFAFSTVLDFTAPEGAAFNLSLPDPNGGPSTPLLSFQRSCQPHCGWNVMASQQIVNDSSATYRSIAIGTNGELFSSFTQDAASLNANVLASLSPMDGATSAVMTVTLDCRTRELSLAFPSCTWTPDAARKGWDGCIYGNGPRGSKTNQTARLILTPLTTVVSPPITSLNLLASNLTHFAFDNPFITASGRKWGDGHVTLMKAYDDGAEQGMEVLSLGDDDGGASMDLGHSASFQLRISRFETGDIPAEEQFYSIRGWPGAQTNRPAPPPMLLRLAQSSSGVDCAADFATFGVSNVTLQLRNGTTLVNEKAHVPASLATPLATLSGFPGILGCPGLGVLGLANTNPFTVVRGLDCTTCEGTELRIIPEFSTTQSPPAVFTDLQCQASEGLDLLLYRFQRTLACVPGQLNVIRSTDGITLTWADENFHLQGAENVTGPWYDLGVSSPVNLPANFTFRAFRLVCD